METLIQVMESTIAARDPYTVHHQKRVTEIACEIATAMGLAEDRLQSLRIAATLHDLGKVAIPTELLSKPGKLTTLEFDLVKTHPQVAYNILTPVSLPGDTAEIILQHHERLDGSGYPHGLKGRAILLEARILGVADVLEAMCSHRPYRPARGMAEAVGELVKNQGILYDPAVVDVCLQLYGQNLPAADAESLAVMPPPELAPWGNVIQATGKFAKNRLRLPEAKRKTWRWNRLFPVDQRAWMHIGSFSLLGFLMTVLIIGI